MSMKASPKDVSQKEILLELKKLSSSNSEIRAEMGKLSSSNSEIRSEMGKLSASNSEIRSEMGKLSSSNSEIRSEMGKLSSSNSEIRAEMGKLSAKLDSNHQESMEAVQGLAQHMDERFDAVDQRLTSVEREQSRMRAVVVTKDYLDDKLADLKHEMRSNTAKQIEKALK